MRSIQRVRRTGLSIVVLLLVAMFVLTNPEYYVPMQSMPTESGVTTLDKPPDKGTALAALEALAIKGRAPKTDYDRTLFGSGWSTTDGCDTRNLILYRDLEAVITDDACRVIRGTLADPYTGKVIMFTRGVDTSQDVQIDHVVALSDAWQKGAQALSAAERIAFANDPLELMAVDGEANQQKSDGDAATWLPANKAFRCQYVARQIAVKKTYRLWVTQAEHDVMKRILTTCPSEPVPVARKTPNPV